MNKLPLLLLPFSLFALADSPPARPIPSEQSANAPAALFFDDREIAPIPSEAPPQPAAPATHLADASADDNSLEAQINRAIIARDWATLPALLERYHAEPQHDPTLYDYALGALRRSQLRHDEATALYRGIVQRQPELAYPRFDLGVMLFENKQYREAQRELERAKPDLSPEMQTLAERYLAAINEAQNWQPEMSLQCETTDNVNNAADARETRSRLRCDKACGWAWQKRLKMGWGCARICATRGAGLIKRGRWFIYTPAKMMSIRRMCRCGTINYRGRTLRRI